MHLSVLALLAGMRGGSGLSQGFSFSGFFGKENLFYPVSVFYFAMLTKKQLLLKSIRELLALKVSDEEIVLNLREVGIDDKEAKRLIEEAKQPGLQAAGEAEVPPPEEPGPAKPGLRRARRMEQEKKIEEKREEAMEELASQVSGEEEEVQPEEIAEAVAEEKRPKKMPEKKPNLSEILRQIKSRAAESSAPPVQTRVRQEPEPPKTRLVEDMQVSKLWEKGILAAVNNRLAEMKELKQDIDSELDRKVAEANRREMEKIRVLLDSQRSLLVSKVDAELEVKAKGFAEMIELKLREMREINRQINSEIERLKEIEGKSRVGEEALAEKLAEVDKLKESVLASLNVDLIKIRTESREIMGAMAGKLQEMDDRINKTLQLESQIVEGLMGEAEKKVGELIEERAAGLSEAENKRLKEFNALKETFEAEQERKLAKVEEEYRAGIKALDAQIRERLSKFDALHKAVTNDFDPKVVREQMRELNEFKAQFIGAIKENAQRYNEGIRRINEQAENISKQFALRAEKIDRKIAELDAFEKNFAAEMGIGLEKLKKK